MTDHTLTDTPGQAQVVAALRRKALLERAELVAKSGSWEWNPETDEVLWSDNHFRLFGLQPGEVVPSPGFVFELTHPDDRDRVQREVQVLGREGEYPPIDFRIILPDGGVRHMRSTVAEVERVNGHPQLIVGSVQDVTDQRCAEREIAAHVAVAESLVEWESLEPGSQRLLAKLAEAMDCVIGVLWVPAGDVLVARVFWSAASADVREFESVTRKLRLARGVDLPGKVWAQREPVNLIGELGQLRRVAALHAVIRRAFALPALNGDEVLAVFEFCSREETELTERLMRSLTGIGHELGQFLRRRRGELEAPALTPRELEVLQLAAQGHSGREIAERLVVSPATVKTHLSHIYGKLGVCGRASAVAKALRDGLIA